jgi:hypothetical protein
MSSYSYTEVPAPPDPVVGETHGSSCTWWIVLFVLFLLVAIGLGIWLLVLYLGGHIGCSSNNNRIVTLTGASITANGNSITGTWGKLNSSTDKVTLYVSDKPFVFNDNGTVNTNNSTVQQDSQVGSNGKITITVSNNMAYNAMMIVTGDNTVHYRIFGPKKVFTQSQDNIKQKIFNIQNLNSCNGAVSNSGTYATSAVSFGQYRLGPENNTSTDNTSLLIKLEENNETEQVLCRNPTATQLTQVSLGYWVNKDATATPVICTNPNPTTADNTTCNSTSTTVNNKISLENCQWSYNSDPSQPNMAGTNQWCLTSLGTTTINSSVKEPLCLSINGSNLAVTNGQLNTDTWFNQILN